MRDSFNSYVASDTTIKTGEDQPIMVDGLIVSSGDFSTLRDRYLAGDISGAQVRAILQDQLTLTTALRRNRRA